MRERDHRKEKEESVQYIYCSSRIITIYIINVFPPPSSLGNTDCHAQISNLPRLQETTDCHAQIGNLPLCKVTSAGSFSPSALTPRNNVLYISHPPPLNTPNGGVGQWNHRGPDFSNFKMY